MIRKHFFSLVMLLTLAAGQYAAGVEDAALFPIIKDGKWGYMDVTGKVVIAPQYDCAWEFSDGLGCVQVGLNRGYIDGKGTMVIQPQYILTRPFVDGMAAVFVGEVKWGGLPMIGYGGGSGQWVYIDKTGKVVLTYKGDSILRSAGEFYDGLAKVTYSPKWGLGHVWPAHITKDGKLQAIGEGVVAGRYSEGMAFYQPGKRSGFGFKDTTGKEAIPQEYEDAGDFSEGLAPVAMKVDVNDPAQTKEWTRATKHVLAIRDAQSWGPKRGELDDADAVGHGEAKTFTFMVTAPKTVGKCNFQCQMFQGDSGFGAFSTMVTVKIVAELTNAPVAIESPKPADGSAALKPAAPAVSSAKPNAPVQVNGATFVSQNVPDAMTTGQTYKVSVTMKNTGPKVVKWGFIDKTNAKVIQPQFGKARSFSGGLAAAAISEEQTSVGPGGKPAVVTVLRWGCIDKTGKIVVQPQYDFVGPLSEGMIRIVAKGKHGYIDATGKMIIEPKFDYAWDFSKGLARVAVGDCEGYVDKTGKYVWEPKESVYGKVKAVVKELSATAKE